MATANIYNHTGKKIKTLALPKAVFASSVNPSVISQALYVYKSNQSQHTSKVKTRGEVALTKAKAYRQKGTGKARHGAKSAPIFVGGGVAHGPKAIVPNRKKLNSKIRQSSLTGAFTHLAKNNAITIISDPEKISTKTKDLSNLIKKLNLRNQKLLFLTNNSYPHLNQAAKNIRHLTISRHYLTNVYQLFNTNHLFIDQNSLKPIIAWLINKKSKSTAKNSASKQDLLK